MIGPGRIPAARAALDGLLAGGPARHYLPDDPVGIVREYAADDDRELVGLLAALLAYGRVASIRGSLKTLFSEWGDRPAAALRDGRHLHPSWAPGFQHRWTRRGDVQGLFEAVRQIWAEEGSLGRALAARARSAGSFEGGLAAWTDDLRTRAAGLEGSAPGRSRQPSRGLRFLLADPSGNSACKRLRLFLRWMVRPDDGVDLGIWSAQLDPGELVLPLDVHWTRIGARLGLTRRRIPDGRMALEITESLRRIRPEDPLIYDFPVCHLCIAGGCPTKLPRGHCGRCPLLGACPSGRRRIASTVKSTRMQDPST